MNAILKGKTAATEEAVVAVPDRDFTSTWRPYSHGSVLWALRSACEAVGLVPERKQYSLSKTGDRMFGVWEVTERNLALPGTAALGDDNGRLAIGVRNSMDKRLAVGLCCGQRVFVCDNLAFSSDLVLFRKHTGQLTEGELYVMAKEALVAVISQYHGLASWLTGLRAVPLTVKEEAALVLAAMRRGVLSPDRFMEFYSLYFNHDTKYTHTLAGFHGALTELLNGRSLLTAQARNRAINSFLRYEAPFYTSGQLAPELSVDDVAALADREAERSNSLFKADAAAGRKAMRRAVRKGVRELKAATE